ncbi:prepilin-type N-terminal cleavage/methylation domain-containing protein [Candidatus Dojkabacteria bacterium]|nr:prepilin-type N-terminal cleavage/methylation domain-containing protein [Candidatus Dojkabacteria bacterium]
MKEVYKYKIKLQLTAKRLELKAIRQCSLQAFTLLELLLVIAIIAVLAGIIMFALNPAERLQEANDVKAVANSKDLEKALRTYALDNNGNVPVGLSTISQSGIYDICKFGETIGCINLDNLITSGYMGSIPVDTRNATSYTTGYKVDYNITSKDTKIYTQEDYERETNYCPTGNDCNGPVGEWLFDDPSAGSGLVALDTSGNNNNGTLSNGPVWVDGKSGKALQFDGIDDKIQTTRPIISGSGDFTMSAWINRNVLGSTDYIVGNYGVSSCLTGIEFYIGNNKLYMYISGYLIGTSTININTWYHVVASRTAGIGKLYLNGKEEISGNISSSIGTNCNMTIGNGPNYNSEAFNGLIDQVKIFDYARTPAQIAWEYNQGLPIAYWKLDETLGITAVDSSSNGNNGTLVNGPTWALGKYGNGLSFDGADDYTEIIGSTVTNNLLSEGTVSLWMKRAGANGAGNANEGMIGKGYCYLLYNGFLRIYDGSNYYITAPQWPHKVVDTNWHHVSASWGSGGMNYYLDGKLVATNAFVGTGGSVNCTNPSTYKWRVGYGYQEIEDFNGQIDDVRIYNYALTQAQVMQVMQGN